MRSYQDFLDRKRREYGDKFNESDLDPRFIGAYESGRWIKVREFGEVRRGRVGVTTGWRPVFILLQSWNAQGSSILLNNNVEVI